MKRNIISLMIITMLTLSVSICPLQAKPGLMFNLDYANKYLAGISGMKVYSTDVLQPSLTILPGWKYLDFNIAGTVWASYSYPKWNEDFGDEVDITLTFSRQVNDLQFGLNASYYNLFDLETTKGDLTDLTWFFERSAGSITNYLKLELAMGMDPEILEGGFLYRAGLILNMPLDFTFDVSVAGHNGAFSTEVDWLNSAKTSFGWHLNLPNNLQLQPTISYQKGLGEDPQNGGLADNCWWLSINYQAEIIKAS
ncbi:MAG: hypothetical protein COU22_03260 [Candidatus Komeilibacteria bacterium CG10_big_fil_rev_8_21_14_0_10_41_13]|uniref:Uncharacterized protein n=1 Tax=Candidatus Komeilibacteria bacterium CG10_big_fil_rev_8_21_14_0_10_41_13 TaxID=1974476 RepID=A0A2M6WBR0_9BACT|nr:MAG: hypothetical protein COU22_03260 [Candidatus Komeilibacteria bacterium CG10_big_fil_rev_8_21_14_0_10_41_13]